MDRAAKSSGTALSCWLPMTLRQRSTRACVAACQASLMPSMPRCPACSPFEPPGAAVRIVQSAFNPSLTHSLAHSLTHSLTHSPTQSLLASSPTHSLTHPPTRLSINSFNHLIGRSFIIVHSTYVLTWEVQAQVWHALSFSSSVFAGLRPAAVNASVKTVCNLVRAWTLQAHDNQHTKWHSRHCTLDTQYGCCEGM